MTEEIDTTMFSPELQESVKENKKRGDALQETLDKTKADRQPDKIGVHASHCCILHGCKYGDDETCPVVTGEVKQKYVCEECFNEGIKSVDDIKIFNGETLDAFGIWIVGHDAYPVVIFRYEEEAVEWARENYFGAWLMKRVQMPAIPFATEEEFAEAKIEAEKMSALFKQLPKMD